MVVKEDTFFSVPGALNPNKPNHLSQFLFVIRIWNRSNPSIKFVSRYEGLSSCGINLEKGLVNDLVGDFPNPVIHS